MDDLFDKLAAQAEAELGLTAPEEEPTPEDILAEGRALSERITGGLFHTLRAAHKSDDLWDAWEAAALEALAEKEENGEKE